MVKVVSHLSHNWPLVFVFQAQPEILIWSFGQALQLSWLVFSTSFLHLRSSLQHLARPTLHLCCLSAAATLQNTELNLKILLKRGEGFEQSKVSHWFGSWKGIDVTGSSLQLSWAEKFCSELWKMQRSRGEQVVLRTGKGDLCPFVPRRLPRLWPCEPDVRSQGGVKCSPIYLSSSVGENCHPLLSFKQRVTVAWGD